MGGCGIETSDAAVKAMQKGEADCIVSNSGTVSDYLKNNKLHSVFLTKEADVSFAVQQGEPVLLSILNKTLTSMPTTQFSGAVVSYNASLRKVTAKDFIQDNLLMFSLIVGIFIFVVLCIILDSLKKSKRAEEKSKKSAEQALKLNQELEEKQQELHNALVEAQSANKAKSSFLNNMSHDIRTPMNAIIGFTALATTHIGSTELVLDYLKKIQTSSQHLLSLINDVLDMSRIESGSVRIEYTTVHLPDILHDLRTIIQGSVYSKQQDLYIDTQDVFHEDIIIDKLRLTQVLLNIISNAVKFTPVGGMINIRVSEKPCRREGYTTVIFSVKDNGIGMSPEFCKQVFDSFSREHTVTENGIGGTGLGMAITKNIVDMMGGTIQVESEVGKGTEFTVILECETSGVTVKREPIPELKGARALVVDDDAETCMSVSKMLREIEMTADWTTSGKEAVLRAREAYEQNQEFKVYIIDWLMPDMNGIETVRRIRMVVGPESPIIILTAYDWSDVEQEAREAGVTAFVSKPLFLSELREVLMSPEQRKLIQNENQKIQAASQTSYAGKKVLLVEDNELNREIATAIMEEIGLDVDVAEDGTDAVNIMSSERGNNYDLIFMDIQMPKMDGYTATREIRTLNNSKCANIPIIAMTANAFEEDRKKAIKAGMNGHIAKPISSDVILENLDQIFGR